MTEKTDNNQSISHPNVWVAPAPIPPNPWDIERRVSLLEQSTKTIKEELGKINTNISKLVWIVLTAVILALLNMVINGDVPGIE